MIDRRSLLTGTAALALSLAASVPLNAQDNSQHKAILKITKGQAITRGKVILGIPQIAENGLSVFTTVSVDSPMTEAEHVRAIHLFSEKNPIAHVATFSLGPRAGRAKVSTNIRLAASQQVTAIAELSDGSFWSDERIVIVTIAACIDGG